MNILHFFGKLNFLGFWEIVEETVLAVTFLVMVLDAVFFYRLFPLAGLERRKALIPYYNWHQIYCRFWNSWAFWEHIGLEIAGMVLPIVIGLVGYSGTAMVLLALDVFLAFMALRHHYEINMKMFEHFEVPRVYVPLIFVLDLSLLVIVIRNRKRRQDH
ncbi:MAG: hypothetical protein IKX74_04620 [Erysipelotrichaceae bacterium]|nr:hypothetical protein [Erysipelotrichaceae bacterium]MBR5048904.1 hypothetical protein [Erysipelotrichaceae bacterium]